jgi:plasmid maintenance system antidote protein VapI
MARLKAFANERGLSQAALAELLHCRQPHISRVFSGEKGVGLELAASIERATSGGIRACEWAARQVEAVR